MDSTYGALKHETQFTTQMNEERKMKLVEIQVFLYNESITQSVFSSCPRPQKKKKIPLVLIYAHKLNLQRVSSTSIPPKNQQKQYKKRVFFSLWIDERIVNFVFSFFFFFF